MKEENKPEEKSGVSINEFVKLILTKMSAEEALKRLLSSTIQHYEKLKLEKQPEDNPESVSPYFILAAAAMDLGWLIVVESEETSTVVRGLTVGTEEYMDNLFKNRVKPEDLGALLFNIHTHADLAASQNTDQIVYREEDLIKVLKAVGLPEPKWGGNMSIEEFLEKKEKK